MFFGGVTLFFCCSMEETEILCDKMALMVKGRFRCIGDIQYLKLKYTHGYTVTLQLRPANPYTMDDDISQIKKLIIGQYRCELKEETLVRLELQGPARKFLIHNRDKRVRNGAKMTQNYKKPKRKRSQKLPQVNSFFLRPKFTNLG